MRGLVSVLSVALVGCGLAGYDVAASSGGDPGSTGDDAGTSTDASGIDASPNLQGMNKPVTSSGSTSSPVLAWTGSGWGLAFIDDPTVKRTLVFETLSETGQVVSEPVAITADSELAYDPDLIWTGSQFVLVWAQGTDGGPSSGDAIELARVDESGNLMGSSVDVYPSDANRSNAPRVAGDDTGLAVVWTDDKSGDEGVHFVLVSQDTGVGAIQPLQSPGKGSVASRPSIVLSSTDQYVVAWNGLSTAYKLTTLARDATRGGTTDFGASTDTGATPELATLGDGTAVSWRSPAQTDANVSKVDPAMPSLSALGSVSASFLMNIELAADQEHYVLCWDEGGLIAYRPVQCASFTAAGARDDLGTVLSLPLAQSGRLALAGGSGDFGVAWSDGDVYFNRLSP